MNKIITTSIALAVASTASFANGDWLELDQDIASLSSTVANAGGTEVGALLRNSYRDGGTTGGWSFEDVLVNMTGNLEEFGWRVSFNIATGTLVLEDAYVTWNYGGDITTTWGQFSLPMFRSSTIGQESMLFIDRSLLGANYYAHDNGVSIAGHMEGLGWTIAAQNGTDGSSEDLNLFAHIEYNLGNGANTHSDGAMLASDELDGTIGVSYMDMQDDSIDAVLGIDFAMTMGQFSLQAELADAGDDTVGGGLGEAPFGLTLGYLFADNMEAAYRHEDRDDAGDTSRESFGLNYYLHGHNAKWQINYIDDDAAADEVIAVGLTIGASS